MPIEAAPIVVEPSGDLYAHFHIAISFVDTEDHILICSSALGLTEIGRPSS